MEKVTKCIISLLNIDKRLFTNKMFVDGRFINMYDKFIEIKFKYNAKWLYYLKSLAEQNNTFFKAEYKESHLYVYFLIPKKYHWLCNIAASDTRGISKYVLNLAFDYWTF